MTTFNLPFTRLACAALLVLAAAMSGARGQEKTADNSRVVSFFMEVPEDAIALTHGGKGAGITPFPEGILGLEETTIANTLALTVRLRDATGNLVGLASELEHFPTPSRPDGSNVWNTYWTVMVPGRGSLLLYERESLGPDVARVFHETPKGTEDWTGSLTRPSNVGPLPNGHGIVAGGTGEFAGATGSFQEIGTLKRFTPAAELTATIELRIHLDQKLAPKP